MAATVQDDSQVIGFRVSPELFERAQRMAKARNFHTVSELMRSLLRQHLEENEALIAAPAPKKGKAK